MANIMPVPMKTPKLDKVPTQPKSSPATMSTMSIFPTTSKPHPSLTTSPSKQSVVSPSISTTITPVSSSQSLLKSASTVISVGSGQLTITPSISITPNPSTKLTSVLPQMPAPSFNIQKPMQPKVRRSTGDKPTKASQKVQRLSQGSNIYPDLPPITVENLPKSLSIIPSPSSFVPTKPGAISPINISALTNKPAKVPKPKKKSIDGNKNAVQAKKLTPQMTGIDPNLLKKSLTAQQLQSLNPLMSQYNYLSHYQQFLTGVPPTPLQLPKAPKSKTSTVTSAGTQQQKAAIKVKQLDQLQGRATKVNEKSAPKSKQMPFSTPNLAANVKNPPVSKSPTVLNAYGTTISSITHGAQSMPTSFTSLPTAAAAAANLPGNLQIR